jgi:TATA-box binding protein (TBP) (component of TFIID and TFIIIB)
MTDSAIVSFKESVMMLESEVASRNGVITTMTTFFPCDNAIIQFEELKVDPEVKIRYPGTPINKKRKRQCFNNAFMLEIERNSRKVVAKVFRTGVHITGTTKVEDSIEVFTTVKRKLGGDVICSSEPKLQLLNCVMNHGKRLDLEDTKANIVKKTSGFDCIYDRDTYAGLRVKNRVGGGTLMIFPSGKMILSGIQKTDQITRFDPVIAML